MQSSENARNRKSSPGFRVIIDPVPRGFVRRRSSVGLEDASLGAKEASEPVNIPVIPHGDPRVRSKLKFEVITARVSETAGKKHVVNRNRRTIAQS